ncbi:MAG: BatA domain-containing protein [Acidobacteria bacterium]|nr:BatA domain-containing protein [Acidobacteriota bacterium]MBI3656135.1 BatA domain-containing protein [Acidobacteriota bacterium]
MSFLNPLFLAGFVTLAIPILIHLVKRERAQKLYFSSLRFLRPVHQRTLKYLRLKNLWLLLLRMAALALIVLAFARPYSRSWEKPPRVARARLVAILIDHSFSMGYKDTFLRAKNKARAVIAGLTAADKAFVAAFGTRLSNQSPPLSDHHQLNAWIDKIELTPSATDYVNGLSAAGRILSEHGEGRHKVIYLISDFHKTGFRRQDEFVLGHEIELKPIDVAYESPENLAVSRADFVKDGQLGDSGHINVRAVNFSAQRKSATLRLVINGKELGRKDAVINKESAEVVSFDKITLFPGSNRGRIELSDDDLKIDNTYHFTIDTDYKVKVLMVTQAGKNRRALIFAEQALSIGAYPPNALTIKSAPAVKAADFEEHDLIILNEIDALPADHIKSLRSSLERGKGVWFVMGEPMDAARFNAAFGGISPAKLVPTNSASSAPMKAGRVDREPRMLTFLKTDHPIFRPFAERHSGNFAASVFFAIMPLEPKPEATILAKFDDGSPALLEAKVGKGVVLLYSSTLDDRWNNLPLNPVYLPFMHQVARHAAHASQTRHAFTVGEAIPLERLLPISVEDMMSEKVTVLDPDGSQVRTPGAVIFAEKPGFYEVRSEKLIKYVAVNPDPLESDLRRMDINELASAVTKLNSRRSETREAATPADEEQTKETQEKNQSWWIYMLAASIVLLAGETFLANQAASLPTR